MIARTTIAIAAVLVAFAAGSADARHARPRHAHLTKHPHQVAVTVHIPQSALKQKPRHKRKPTAFRR